MSEDTENLINEQQNSSQTVNSTNNSSETSVNRQIRMLRSEILCLRRK